MDQLTNLKKRKNKSNILKLGENSKSQRQNFTENNANSTQNKIALSQQNTISSNRNASITNFAFNPINSNRNPDLKKSKQNYVSNDGNSTLPSCESKTPVACCTPKKAVTNDKLYSQIVSKNLICDDQVTSTNSNYTFKSSTFNKSNKLDRLNLEFKREVCEEYKHGEDKNVEDKFKDMKVEDKSKYENAKDNLKKDNYKTNFDASIERLKSDEITEVNTQSTFANSSADEAEYSKEYDKISDKINDVRTSFPCHLVNQMTGGFQCNSLERGSFKKFEATGQICKTKRNIFEIDVLNEPSKVENKVINDRKQMEMCAQKFIRTKNLYIPKNDTLPKYVDILNNDSNVESMLPTKDGHTNLRPTLNFSKTPRFENSENISNLHTVVEEDSIISDTNKSTLMSLKSPVGSKKCIIHLKTPKGEEHASTPSIESDDIVSNYSLNMDDRAAQEIRILKRDLENAHEKINTLTSQLKTNAYVVSAFEQSMADMTTRLNNIMKIVEMKDYEIDLLKRSHKEKINNRKDTNLKEIKNTSLDENHFSSFYMESSDGRSSLNSDANNSSFEKTKKKLNWSKIGQSFRKAFSPFRNTSSCNVNVNAEESMSQIRMNTSFQESFLCPLGLRSPSSITRRQHLSVPCTPIFNNRKNISSFSENVTNEKAFLNLLQDEMHEKDMQLTELKLENLSTTHQLEQYKENLNILKIQLELERTDNIKMCRLFNNRRSSVDNYQPDILARVDQNYTLRQNIYESLKNRRSTGSQNSNLSFSETSN